MFWIKVTNKKGLLLLETKEVVLIEQVLKQRDALERAYPDDEVTVLSHVVTVIRKETNDAAPNGTGKSPTDTGTNV